MKPLRSIGSGVTISMQTGRQGHPIPIYTPNIHKKYPKHSFFYFSTRSPYRWTNGWTDGWTNGWTDKADELCIHIWKSFSSFSFSSSGVYTVLDLLEIIANNAGFQYNCGWEGRGIQHPPFTLHLHTHFIQSQPQHPNCISSHFSTQALPTD